MCERAERASLENFLIYMFQNSYFFQCLNWYFWYEFCLHITYFSVTLLHQIVHAIHLSFYYIIYWHYSQTTGKHLRRDNLCCMRAIRASEENGHISTFQVCYISANRGQLPPPPPPPVAPPMLIFKPQTRRFCDVIMPS